MGAMQMKWCDTKETSVCDNKRFLMITKVLPLVDIIYFISQIVYVANQFACCLFLRNVGICSLASADKVFDSGVIYAYEVLLDLVREIYVVETTWNYIISENFSGIGR